MTDDACYTRVRVCLDRWVATLPRGVDMSEIAGPLFDENGDNFENSGRENGHRYWYARDFMVLLGYEGFDRFEKAVDRAIRACGSLSIPLVEAIQPIEREIDGVTQRDYKLSRFGCYLVAINGDPRKPQVAAAQAYFVTLAEAFRQYLQRAEHVDRLVIRDDIAEREHALSGVAHNAGVENFAFFQNAGYRGMYNMNLGRLRDLRGIDKTRSPLDFMGREELAANLFRITQTEAKIKNEALRGQARLEQAAETVGRKVRQTMQELSGTAPESLPVSEDIRNVKKGLKGAHKQFTKIDKPPAGKALPRKQ
jgi:DNA-damage-inducible protein D